MSALPTRTALLIACFLGVGCGGAAPYQSAAAKFAGGEAQAPPADQKDAPAERKLIYRAFLDVVVKDLDESLARVEKALAAHKGYVAKSDQRSDTSTRRYATFTIRVPAEALRPLLGELKTLGTAERDAIESDDVTEEFRDVQVQIKNLKAEEETLNRLMKEKAGSVEDVLKVRQQIQPIRERIDRAEGRFEYLAKMTALSTVTLTLREIKDYKPVPTSFGSRAGRSFSDSVGKLVEFLETAALAVVSAVPWLPIIVPVAVVGALWVRRRLRKARVATLPAAEVVADDAPPPVGTA